MGVKNIVYGNDARLGILRGVEKTALAVGATMGPRGQNVIIEKLGLTPTITFDGVTVAKELSLPDQWEDIGVRLCKEVSSHTNEDSGDGTTTATVLAHNLLYEALKLVTNGYPAIHVKKGIQAALIHVLHELECQSYDVQTRKDIVAVAKIACEDEEMANVVADALEEVGRDGIITVEDGKKVETYLESTSGMGLEKTGYLDPVFINQDDSTCVLDNPYIFCFDGRLEAPMVAANLMNAALEASRGILFVADDFGADVRATILQNAYMLKESLPICAIKTPMVGRKRQDLLEDIAVLTGAEVCSRAKGDNPLTWTLDQCGSAAKFKAWRHKVEIINGDGTDEAIQERVARLRHEIATSTSEFDRQKMQERLGRLVGGLTVIRVGAYTETELREKKRRMEDALSATRSAIEEGIVAGGGYALLQAGFTLPTTEEKLYFDTHLLPGYLALRKATEAPVRHITENAGYNASTIIARLEEYHQDLYSLDDIGLNIQTGEYVELFEEGIVDPLKVIRCALENAVSFATTTLMTAVAISEKDMEEARMKAKEI